MDSVLPAGPGAPPGAVPTIAVPDQLCAIGGKQAPHDTVGLLGGRRPETSVRNIHRCLRPGGWMLVSLGTKDTPAWLEANFFGFGATSWATGWDTETNLSLVAESGFTSGVVTG